MYVSKPTRLPQPPRRLELIKVTSPLRPSFTGTEPPGVRGRQARTFPRQVKDEPRTAAQKPSDDGAE